MNVISWNCRGLEKKIAQTYCRRMIATYSPAVVILLETQLSEKSLDKVFIQFGRGWKAFAMHALGRCGGIVMLVKESAAQFCYLGVNRKIVAVKISGKNFQDSGY